MPDIRDALAAAVQARLVAAVTDAGSNVFLWRDWPLNSAKLPAIVVRARRLDRRDLTGGNGAPRYLLSVWLEIDCFTQSSDSLVAETAARSLEQQADPVVQSVIIGPPQTFTRIADTTSEIDVTAEGRQHNGSAELRYAFEVQECFAPSVIDALAEVLIVAARDFAAGDSDVNAPLSEPLAGAEFPIPG